VARRSRPYFKASPWELDDAAEEGIRIVENHAPKRFVIENGKLVGMEFERLRWTDDNSRQTSTVIDKVTLPCDEVILAIGQDNAFPWIERDMRHSMCTHASHQQDHESTRRGGFSAATPQTSSGQSSTAIRRRSPAPALPGRQSAAPAGGNASRARNGAALVGVLNDFNPSER
jgi:NADPH-dependent glutamate synthase beta subunit-like oxidoreductase